MSPLIQITKHPAALPPRADTSRQTQRANVEHFYETAKKLGWTYQDLCTTMGVSPGAWKEWKDKDGMPLMGAWACDQIYAKFGPHPIGLDGVTPIQVIGDDVWVIDAGAEAEFLIYMLDWAGLTYTVVEKNSFVLRPGDDAPRLRELLDKKKVSYEILSPPAAKEAA